MTAENAAKSAPTPPDQKVVQFEHKVFSSMEEAYFRLSEQNAEEPVMVVNFGGNEVALPFGSLRKEFGIEADSADDRMLGLVAEGLSFVVLLRPGDPIPTELLTGAPTAEISPDHRQIAYHRLTMQLVTWVSGGESLITDREQLAQIAEDPATKKRINDAMGEAAKQLGLPNGDKDQVLDLIERLADDLAAIEALRDRFGQVQMIERKIQALRRALTRQQMVLEIVDPAARLILIASRQFGDNFDQIDAQTGEIISLLKNIDAQVRFIREQRNDLHRRLMAWDDMFKAWSKAKIEDSEANDKLLRETYRFLAPRFMQVDEWALMTKLQAQQGTEVDMRGDDGENKLGKTEIAW